MTQPIIARFQLDYGGFQLNIDLSLPGSGISVLFGHSGSGKTSLLRCIAGLQQASSGFLKINGQVWQDSEQGIFLPTYQRPLGYVFQEANLFPHLNVVDNLRFGLKRIGKAFAQGEQQSILDLLDITHLLFRRPEHLSGGERQRVAIARALVLKPQILLMDEPLASLDFKRKQEILPFLSLLHRELNIPVIYVTHSHQEVAQLADHLVMLSEGRVLASGPLAETLGRLDVALANEREAATVWAVEVIGHETDYQLTRVAFEDVSLSLQALPFEIGTALRIQILARDVSIALQASSASSILNIIPATVTGLVDNQAGQVVVQLRVCSQPLLAHITRKSAVILGLQVGMSVFAQIKGSSILN